MCFSRCGKRPRCLVYLLDFPVQKIKNLMDKRIRTLGNSDEVTSRNDRGCIIELHVAFVIKLHAAFVEVHYRSY